MSVRDPRTRYLEILAGPERDDFINYRRTMLVAARIYGPRYLVPIGDAYRIKPYAWWKRTIEGIYNGGNFLSDNFAHIIIDDHDMKLILDQICLDYTQFWNELDEWKVFKSRQYTLTPGESYMRSRAKMQEMDITDEGLLEIGTYPYTKFESRVIERIIDPFKKRFKNNEIMRLPRTGKYNSDFYNALEEYASGVATVEQHELKRAKAAFDIAVQDRLKLRNVGPFGTNYAAASNLPYEIIRKFHGP